jgi:hypothetical protein
MTTILYCNDPFKKGCHWVGAPEELVATKAEPNTFTHCPQCEGIDFEEDEEDDEDDYTDDEDGN